MKARSSSSREGALEAEAAVEEEAKEEDGVLEEAPFPLLPLFPLEPAAVSVSISVRPQLYSPSPSTILCILASSDTVASKLLSELLLLLLLSEMPLACELPLALPVLTDALPVRSVLGFTARLTAGAGGG